MAEFKLHSNYKPLGDQPKAIKSLVEGLNKKYRDQVLLGITGSGKTFTMANVIQEVQRPTLILSHNKTLAAQLYGEFKSLFPNNAVEYFISYYDYYQPEAYLPVTDTYIEKDSSINEEIDKLRIKATASLISRKDIILEGPTFSVCWIKGDTIFTPSLNLGILDSVTRKYLYAICDDLNSNEEDYNIKIKEVEETIEEIFSSDAVFLLSTAKHAIQVAKVNETLFDLGQNTILNTIQRGYAAIIENEKTKFFDK